MSDVPSIRVRALNGAPERAGAAYVLYWMTASRRLGWNFGLQRAVEAANDHDLPLVILEALRTGYRWASDRVHAFVLDGMREHEEALRGRAGVRYHPYVEPGEGAGSGLLGRLAERAAVVVTDDWPCFFLPRMQEVAAARLGVRVESVDANGLYPMRDTRRVFPVAHAFRRHLQRTLGLHLERLPARAPLEALRSSATPALPTGVVERWPDASASLRSGGPDLAALPIDHAVGPVERRGGTAAGRARLRRFLSDGLDDYGRRRNEPEADAASGLSPWLHFGHVSAHEIFSEIAARESWTPASLSDDAEGKRHGWWGLPSAAEDFLDQLVTWRELGFNRCAHTDDYDRYESLPDWARATLEKHEGDDREHVYDLAAFDAAETHDELWNAAQVQLRREGRIHNYLRMLWGKKILHWTESPRAALEIMIELNNRYALDGRDPNSWSGIFWCLGRYDRAWGPERPVFGKVRYMSSDSTRRKYSVDGYVARYRP
ncbi:MAG: deoxyribodipyrimidine photolyase [Gemmatimonadota bacterium]